jgi:uncharacterized protein YdhG (YjbR/CyaY superfamily)
MDNTSYLTVDHYLSHLENDIKDKMSKIREIIISVAPQATECIAYCMPAFKLHNKPLVYFAAFKNHIGFYALPSGNLAFQAELSNYKTGKGSIQFPLDKEIPYDLIAQIVLFRVEEVKEHLKNGKGKP